MVEVLFFFDFAFCFCQEYKDEEVYAIVTDIKKIAIHYLKGSAVFDFLAIVPFKELLRLNHPESALDENDRIRLFSLFKLLRVPRLFGLLNVERIK